MVSFQGYIPDQFSIHLSVTISVTLENIHYYGLGFLKGLICLYFIFPISSI